MVSEQAAEGADPPWVGLRSSDPYWNDFYAVVWGGVVCDIEIEPEAIMSTLERDCPAVVKHYGDWLYTKVANAVEKARRHLLGRTVASDQRYAIAVAAGRFSKGRKGDSERMVYAALLYIEQRAGDKQAQEGGVHASERRLEKLTGLDRSKTIRSALRRLVSQRLLARLPDTDHDKCSSWRLVDLSPHEVPVSHPHLCISRGCLLHRYGGVARTSSEAEACSAELRVEDSLHVLWSNEGFGVAGEQVWRALQAGPSYVAELARRIGRSRSTVDRKLSLLIAAGMVEQDGRSYAALAGVDLDEVAAREGMTEWRAAKVKRIEGEQKDERDRLAEPKDGGASHLATVHSLAGDAVLIDDETGEMHSAVCDVSSCGATASSLVHFGERAMPFCRRHARPHLRSQSRDQPRLVVEVA